MCRKTRSFSKTSNSYINIAVITGNMDKIEPLRQQLREVDLRILRSLQERFATVKQVWKIKQQWGIGPREPGQEEKILSELKENTILSPLFVEKLYSLIFAENESMAKE